MKLFKLACALILLTPQLALAQRIGIKDSGLGCQWDDLQDAIDAAAPGDVVFIEAGEVINKIAQLVIDKDLTIRASEPGCEVPTTSGAHAVFDQTGAVIGAVLVEARVTLRRVDVIGGYGFPLLGGNILVTSDGHLTLRHSRVENGDAGSGGNIHVEEGGTLIMRQGAKVLGGRALNGYGGNVRLQGRMEMRGNAEVSGGYALYSGGGVMIEWPGTLEMFDSAAILGNESFPSESGWGGGAAVAGTLLMHDTARIGGLGPGEGNSARGGGGVRVWIGGTMAADPDTMIIGNTALGTPGSGGGGGVQTAVSLTLGIVSHNSAPESLGGGVLMEGDIDLTAVSITDNSALRGGGLAVLDGGATTAISIERNSATEFGGGVLVGEYDRLSGDPVASGPWDDVASEILNNTAPNGAGVYAAPESLANLYATTIRQNIAISEGGGLYLEENATVTGTNLWLIENSAVRGGGAQLRGDSPQLTLDSLYSTTFGCFFRAPISSDEYCSEVRGNDADSHGGGIAIDGGSADIQKVAFSTNVSTGYGHAIALSYGEATIKNALFFENGQQGPSAVVDARNGTTLSARYITMADNLSTPMMFGPTANGELLRSIIWDTAPVIVNSADLPAACTLFRSVSGPTSGPNRDFGLDPYFVTTARGRYRLDSASIHAIDQCSFGPGLDLDSDARPVNQLYDRGAFEAQ